MKRSAPNGFTLTEALLTLLCAGVCAMILTSVMSASQTLLSREPAIENGLGIVQLRYRTALSSSVSCQSGNLTMTRNHEVFEIRFSRGRVVQTPGYEIVLEPVKEGRFVCEAGQVWLETETGRIQIR